MKLVWSPETASRAYMDTVKSCKLFQGSTEAELISAMAGGWNAKVIVEAYSHGGSTAASVGLAIAARHTGGRHICMVQDERSRLEYTKAMRAAGVSPPPEVMVGEAEEVAADLVGIDFMVVDGRRKDFGKLIRLAKLGHKGAVLVCIHAHQLTLVGFRWTQVLKSTTRVVRSSVLPVGKGLDIAYIGGTGGTLKSQKSLSRWIKHIDHRSGEEHLIRG